MIIKRNLTTASLLLLAVSVVIFSCEKDVAPENKVITPVFPAAVNPSFVEEFDSASTLSSKGWVFKNNSTPIGTAGWRQGRYESAALVQYKFIAPVPFVGFPAYSASKTPNDFISCDAAAVNNDPLTYAGDISAWLISPQLPLTNGDKIVFYTRAVLDTFYSVYTKDRMEVRANITDGTANVGGASTSVGNFSKMLLEINPGYIYNDPAANASGLMGYPRKWTKYTITISGIPAPGSVAAGRFAFRYLGYDAGLYGGSSGDNFPTVIGIDSLAYIHP